MVLKRASVASPLLALVLVFPGLAADAPTSAADDAVADVALPSVEIPWVADLSALQHGSGADALVKVPVSETLHVTVVLREHELFAPGQKKVVHGDEAGILSEEPLEVFTYHGYVPGFPGSFAAFTFDPTGFIGLLKLGGLTVDYMPAHEDREILDPAAVPMLARLDAETRRLINAHGRWHGEASPESADDSEVPGHDGPSTMDSDCTLLLLLIEEIDLALLQQACNLLAGGVNLFSSLDPPASQVGRVRPYADLSFRTAHSNYDTRITNAINAGKNLWKNQANIEISMYSIFAYSSNYSTSGDCETHLGAFRSTHATLSGIDAYQLFTGIDLSNCNGRGTLPGTSGTLAPDANSIVEAVDHSNTDSYNPGSSDHLGMVSAHEIAHNWGQREHPQNCRNWCTSFNIMAAGKSYHVRDYWFTTKTQQNIIGATSGRLTDPPAIL